MLCKKWKKLLSTLKKKETSSLDWKDDPNPFFFLLIADKILYNIFYTVSLGSRRMYFFYQLQLRLSRMCSENAGKLRIGVQKSCLERCTLNFLIFFILKDVKVLFFILHNNCLHRSQKLAWNLSFKGLLPNRGEI